MLTNYQKNNRVESTMSKTIIAVIGVLVIFFSIFLIGGISVISTYNQESVLKNLYDAKVKANSADFDNTWKKISQSYQVADSNKDALKEVFNGYATARTGTGSKDPAMLWIKEAIPNADLSIYKQVLNIITSSRDGWTDRQKELVDISRQYNQNLSVFPSNFVLKMFGFQYLDAKVITSTRTEQAFESGKDDDVDLKSK